MSLTATATACRIPWTTALTPCGVRRWTPRAVAVHPSRLQPRWRCRCKGHGALRGLCLGTRNTRLDLECLNARLDTDEDVDQTDFGILQQCWSGPLPAILHVRAKENVMKVRIVTLLCCGMACFLDRRDRRYRLQSGRCSRVSADHPGGRDRRVVETGFWKAVSERFQSRNPVTDTR